MFSAMNAQVCFRLHLQPGRRNLFLAARADPVPARFHPPQGRLDLLEARQIAAPDLQRHLLGLDGVLPRQPSDGSVRADRRRGAGQILDAGAQFIPGRFQQLPKFLQLFRRHSVVPPARARILQSNRCSVLGRLKQAAEFMAAGA